MIPWLLVGSTAYSEQVGSSDWSSRTPRPQVKDPTTGFHVTFGGSIDPRSGGPLHQSGLDVTIAPGAVLKLARP